MADEEFKRPSPEALLRLTQQEEALEARGKLIVYFGFAPGVGKTFAMLTDALLDGLEVIPPLVIEYMGVKLRETNLEKVFARKPKLVIVDELAHTNAPGSHNAKRYQDIGEILHAGIDVYTTLNVQHIDSLKRIGGRATHCTKGRNGV